MFSQAKEEDPDRTYVTLTNTVSRKAENGGDAVSGSIWEGDKNITKTLPKSAERRFQHNKDTDWAGYINLSYDTHFANSVEALWKAGAQYRRKERSNRYYSYIFNPADISQRLDGNGIDQLLTSIGFARLLILRLRSSTTIPRSTSAEPMPW